MLGFGKDWAWEWGEVLGYHEILESDSLWVGLIGIKPPKPEALTPKGCMVHLNTQSR